jgi:hypothetical protein
MVGKSYFDPQKEQQRKEKGKKEKKKEKKKSRENPNLSLSKPTITAFCTLKEYRPP